MYKNYFINFSNKTKFAFKTNLVDKKFLYFTPFKVNKKLI